MGGPYSGETLWPCSFALTVVGQPSCLKFYGGDPNPNPSEPATCDYITSSKITYWGGCQGTVGSQGVCVLNMNCSTVVKHETANKHANNMTCCWQTCDQHVMLGEGRSRLDEVCILLLFLLLLLMFHLLVIPDSPCCKRFVYLSCHIFALTSDSKLVKHLIFEFGKIFCSQ